MVNWIEKSQNESNKAKDSPKLLKQVEKHCLNMGGIDFDDVDLKEAC